MICTKYIVLEYTNNIKDKISACIILNRLWNYSAKSSAGRAAVVVPTVTEVKLHYFHGCGSQGFGELKRIESRV